MSATNKGMGNYIDERDLKLLEQDPYTFFVMRRLIGGGGRLLLTDHERLILFFTEPPYPVWIWTPDDATAEEMDRAYRLCKENSLLNGENSFNLKYELAEHFIERAAEEGKKLSISMNMYAYDCPEPIRPKKAAEGGIYKVTEKDLEELTDIIGYFHEEIGIDQRDRDSYRSEAESYIQAGKTFLWKDAEGRTAASCKYDPSGDAASINLVYTFPEQRRKHYAENLVYQVVEKARAEGYMPMLYTNADYVASNACYEGIGFVLKGKLCTLG